MTLYEPTTVEQTQQIVASAEQIKVLGTGHSFSDIGAGEQLVSLAKIAPDYELEANSVACSGAVTYGELAIFLQQEGSALHNLASLPHISVAGAIQTATHGSGDTHPNLACAVTSIDLITSDGELHTIARGDEDFDGAVVGLGSLGVVTRVTLEVEPTYEITQTVYLDVAWPTQPEHLTDLTSAGYSVSLFTTWGP